jgi:hypothetical protein
LLWGGGDGTIYLATGMEQNGVIAGNPIFPFDTISTLERPDIVASGVGGEAVLFLGINADNVASLARSFDGSTFPGGSNPFELVGTDTAIPVIGGPALLPQPGAADTTLLVAATVVGPQTVQIGAGPPPGYFLPALTWFTDTTLLSIDTPALGQTPQGNLQVAFAGPDPTNNLTVAQLDPVTGHVVTSTTYPDECFGGPALVETVNGYAAAYVNKANNITLLYGVDALNPQNVNRSVFTETSWHAPAVATIDGVTYLAWIGTDQAEPTGELNFADLGSMTPVSCALNQLAIQEAGVSADEMTTRWRQLREDELIAEPSGRLLVALLDQHGAELQRLLDSDERLRREAWDVLQLAAPALVPAERNGTAFTPEMVEAAERLMERTRALASPALGDSIDRMDDLLLPSLRGQTLAGGLAAASESLKTA